MDRIRKISLLFLVLFAIFGSKKSTAKNSYPGEIIVKFKAKVDFLSTGATQLSAIDTALSAISDVAITPLTPHPFRLSKARRLATTIGLDRIGKMHIPSDVNLQKLLLTLQHHPAVEYAQFNHLYQIHDLPNDPRIGEQWLIKQIQLDLAWDLTYGSSDVLIAIIDTGIDYNHEDLSSNLWINDGEDLNHNGMVDASDFNEIDDDGNGFIDDIRGWDFTDAPHFPDGGDYLLPDNDPADENGHGTSVAGIVSATANNGIGIAGVAPGCRLMNLRAGTSQGLLEEDDVASAIIYAVDNGAKIVNMSFGDVATSPLLRDIVQFAHESGLVLIASAGNSSSEKIHYPSGFPRVISVGATDAEDALAGFSNYGATIDLVAPGVNLLTTARENQYRIFSGTSAAAPVVSGVAGLIMSYRFNLTNQDVRNILTSSAEDFGETNWDSYYGAGRIAPFIALQIPHASQATISHPALDQGFYSDSITIMGTASGARLHSYHLFYGTGVNPQDWFLIKQMKNHQIVSDTLGVWSVASLPDTTYIIRLQVQNFDGGSVEHRTRIFLDRTSPQLLSIKHRKMLDGYRYSQLLEFETDDITRATIYYRPQGTDESFREITLNYEVTTHRFNFSQAGIWEFYLLLQNKSGLTSIEDSLGAYYHMDLSAPDLETSRFINLDLALPPIYPLNKFADFDNDGHLEFLGNPLAANGAFGNLTLFEWENNAFVQTEIGSTIFIPRDIGDSDNDGLPEILAGSGPRSFIIESEQFGGIPQTIVWADSAEFWASRFADLDQDGKGEIIGMRDNTFIISENTGDNQYEFTFSLENLTAGSNSAGVPHTEIGDFDNDGKMEILIGDYDGDIYIYETSGDNQFRFSWQQRLPLMDAINFIASGDYDGDGVTEFAAGCHSSPELDLEHEYDGRYWVFRIYDSVGDDMYQPVWEHAFFGFAEPADYASSVTSGDVDNDGTDELLINVFPDFYLIKYNQATHRYQPVGYYSPSRSHANLIGDVDGDGKNEFTINTGSVTVLLQDKYAASFSGPPTPAGFEAHPLDESKVQLRWLPVQEADQYNIYRGSSAEQVVLLSSVSATEFVDSAVTANIVYWYAVTTIDFSAPVTESRQSTMIPVKPGSRPFCQSAQFILPNQLRVQFNEIMDHSIANISAYRFSHQLGKPISAVISRSGEEVLLTLKNDFIPSGNYSVEVNEVRDKDRTPIDTMRNIIDFIVPAQQPSFYLINAEMMNDVTILLTFNFPVDSVSAAQKSNYSFDPSIKIDHVLIPDDNRRYVQLVIAGNQHLTDKGYQFIITVENIFSKSGIPIPKGQGSQTTLTLLTDEISEIYSYPNPCRQGEGHRSITFANLSANETVNIMTTSGKLIRTLDKPDGSREKVWDLKNERGEPVAAGIYIFMVSDGKSTQLGKLAIVR